jgi:hypothetical protein
MSNIKIFYHITCINNWKDIVREQLIKIIYSGLYEKVEEIVCFVIIPDATKIDENINYIKTFGNKIKIAETSTEKKNELYTIKNITNHINKDTKLLYIHTKGVSRVNTTQYNNGSTTFTIPNLYNNIVDWRDYMEYNLIKNHVKCLEQLDTNDCVGVNYVGHYSGNFWWTTGNHYFRIENFRKNDNINDICVEGYITSISKKEAKYFCMGMSGLQGYGHYHNSYNMKNYV